MGDLVAWVDESASVQAKDPGTYLFGVVVMDLGVLEANHQAMVKLKLPGQKKLHWIDEKETRKVLIARTVTGLDASTLVLVRSRPDAAESLERRRRKCLEALVLYLETKGVTRAVLESREASQNRKDLEMLSYLRTRGIGRTIRLDHVPGPVEPMLWAADALCGIVVDARVRAGKRESLLPTIEIIEV